MNYLIITDEQINVAKRLENKGFLILIEVLQSMRDGKKISERGLAKKHELSHQIVRTFIQKIRNKHMSNTRLTQDQHNEVNKTGGVNTLINTEITQDQHTTNTEETKDETKQIDQPAKPKRKRLNTRQKALQGVEINEKTQDAYEVFQHWQQRFGHFSVPFTEQTRELIQGVLDGEYGKDGAIKAIEGCAKNQWYVDNNRTNLSMILRQTKIDEFITYNETTNATRKQNFGSTQVRPSGSVGRLLQRMQEHTDNERRTAGGTDDNDGGTTIL